MFDGAETVLAIGAHPDDEVLGPGGTLSRHAESGADVHVLIVTDGASHQYDDAALIREKRHNARKCADRMGLTDVHFGDLPDMRLDEVAHVEVNDVIQQVCDNVEPDIVYTHSRREVNYDHIVVHRSTIVATRPFNGISRVLAYETPSSTEWTTADTPQFNPSVFIDVSNHVETKISAFEAYESEVREFPHPRSGEALRALAKTRGSAAGMGAAEAFESLRSYY